MKKRNILLSSLAIFALSMNTVSAKEVEEGWTKVDEGTSLVEIDKLIAFEEKLAERVQKLNLSSIESNLNKLYRYRITLQEQAEDNKEENYIEVSNNKSFENKFEAEEWANENRPEKNGWSWLENIIEFFKIDRLFQKTTYETKKEAEIAKEEFEQTIDQESSNITITEIRDESGDKTETVENNEKFYSQEEAQDAANNKNEDNRDYKVVATVVSGEKEYDRTETTDIVITEYFNTKEEAQAYIDGLKTAGYTVENEQIIPITHIETVEELHRDDYVTMEEAEIAAEEFYQKNENKIITGEGATSKLNPEKNIVGELVEGITPYTSKKEAETTIENLPENVEGILREETQITDQIIHGTSDNQVKKVFDTELEALQYIENLKKQGYDVSEVEKELVSFEESIWKDENGVIVNPGTSDGKQFTYNHFDITLLTNFTKIDANGNKSEVTGTVAITNVKINNTKITMEGPTTDPNTKLKEYTSKERNELNITNSSLVEITGTVTFNGTTLPFTIKGYLSESQNVCGGKGFSKGYDLEFESITIINNRVVIDSNIVNQYKITGTAVKSQSVWYVDTKTTTLGYDYSVNLEAKTEVLDGYNVTGTKSKDFYKEVYKLEIIKTVKDYDYEVKGSGEKTLYDVVSKYVKVIDVEWIIESMEFGIGGDVEVLPPQTGIEASYQLPNVITMITSIMAVILLVIKKFI